MPLWRAAVEDLLARLALMRGSTTNRSSAKQRVRLGAPYSAEAEAVEDDLCEMQRVLEAARDPQRLYTAAFWRDTLDAVPLFWEVWWCTKRLSEPRAAHMLWV